MKYADTASGKPFSKDPAVVKFLDRYYLYYSLPPHGSNNGWSIGIAASSDLEEWSKAGELHPEMECEKNGFCAPGAIVLDGNIHIFYQSYGNGPKDAICHAVSEDGVTFQRDPTNPIFSPTGEWNNGRAIDADVIEHNGKLLLYFATRDPSSKIQMLGIASASIDSDFGRDSWKQICDDTILKPELPWEQDCIEAPAVCNRDGKLFMFYAGAYNNAPQQVGCAISEDGVSWNRISETPLLPNGKPEEWNSSESGHPYIFVDKDGRTHLFFQGNNDNGKTWYLSKTEIFWEGNQPRLSKISA